MIHRLLSATRTRDPDERVESGLALYIGQHIFPLADGQHTKIGLTFTQATKQGNVVHPSPTDLWDTDPLFREFVEEKVQFYDKIAASPAVRRTRCVNIICNYTMPYGWLAWKERRSPSEKQAGETQGYSAAW